MGNRDWETCALGDWCGVDVVACAGCEGFAVVWRWGGDGEYDLCLGTVEINPRLELVGENVEEPRCMLS